MNKIIITLLTIVATMAGELFNTTPLSGQSNWLTKSKKTSVTLEMIKPNFDWDDDLTLATSVVFLSARGPISETNSVVVEFPIAHIGFDNSDSPDETLLGNPYFGFEFGVSDTPIFFELGFRIPVASDDKEGAAIVGILSDFERLEAFTPDLLLFTWGVNYQHRNASNIVFRLRGGPSLWVFSSTEEEDNPEDELWLDYSVQVGYENDAFSALARLSGSYWVTRGDDETLPTARQLALAVSWVHSRLRPGVHFRLPFNSGDDVISLLEPDFVLGLSLGVQFD